ANMKSGETQKFAGEPTKVPARPTATRQVSQRVTDVELTVTTPTENSAVTTSEVTITGKTFPNADVFINDTEIKADSSGNFSSTVTLDEGENSILITSNDEMGNSAEQEVTVTYVVE